MNTCQMDWQLPKLHTHNTQGGHRKVTWLELFFDLVFVVVIAQLVQGFAHHPSISGAGQLMMTLLPVWLVWNGHTYYQERFETQGIETRLMVLVLIFGMIWLAYFSHDPLGADYSGFVIAYLLTRGFVMALWWRAAHHNPAFQPSSRWFLRGYTISLALMLLSLFTQSGLHLVLFALALASEILAPWFSRGHSQSLPEFSQSKLPERFGLLVILVLGESLAGTLHGISGDNHFTTQLFIHSILATLLGFFLWWIYFDFVGHKTARAANHLTWIWSYLHLPLVLSLALIGGLLTALLQGQDALSSLLLWAGGAFLLILWGMEKTLEKSTATKPTAWLQGSALLWLTGLFALASAFWINHGFIALLLMNGLLLTLILQRICLGAKT